MKKRKNERKTGYYDIINRKSLLLDKICRLDVMWASEGSVVPTSKYFRPTI